MILLTTRVYYWRHFYAQPRSVAVDSSASTPDPGGDLFSRCSGVSVLSPYTRRPLTLSAVTCYGVPISVSRSVLSRAHAELSFSVSGRYSFASASCAHIRAEERS